MPVQCDWRFPLTLHRVLVPLLAVLSGISIAHGHESGGQQQLPVKAALPAAASSSVSNPFLRVFGNGQWWSTLSDDAKDTFVDGYTTGTAHAYLYTHGFCVDHAHELKPGPQFETQINAAMNLCLLAETFDFDVDGRKLVSGIAEFYKDPQNILIPIQYALGFVRDKLKGKKSAKEMGDELKEWRRNLSQ